MLLSKCAVRNSKKPRSTKKKTEASRPLSYFGLKTPLSKIPLSSIDTLMQDIKLMKQQTCFC